MAQPSTQKGITIEEERQNVVQTENVPVDPFILNQTRQKRRYAMLEEHTHAYPKNVRENYVLGPVETKTSRHIDLRVWYPSRWYKDLYFPSKQGIDITTEEACEWIIRNLTKYKSWIIRGPGIQKLRYPSPLTDMPFQTADERTAHLALKEVWGEAGEKLPEFQSFLDRQTKPR